MASCEICKTKFSSRSNFKKHQLKAKYCLKLRNNYNQPQFNCEFCDKIYTTKLRLTNHHKLCTFKESIEKDKLIEKLQNIICAKNEQFEFFLSKLEEKEIRIIELKAKCDVYRSICERDPKD